MDEVLLRLVMQIERLAPEVWEVGLRQVEVTRQAKQLWWGPVGLLLLLGLGLDLWMVFHIKRNHTRWFQEDVGGWIAMTTVLSVGIGIGAIIAYNELVVQWVMLGANPEYYALELLKAAVK